jgi:hypothetical protein
MDEGNCCPRICDRKEKKLWYCLPLDEGVEKKCKRDHHQVRLMAEVFKSNPERPVILEGDMNHVHLRDDLLIMPLLCAQGRHKTL